MSKNKRKSMAIGQKQKLSTKSGIFLFSSTLYWEIPKRLGDLVNYKRKGENKMKKKLSFLGAVFSAGMLLAACGGDDTTSPEEGAGTEGGSSDLNLVEEGKFTSA